MARETPVIEVARLMRQFYVGDLVLVDESSGLRRSVDFVIEVMAMAVAPETPMCG